MLVREPNFAKTLWLLRMSKCIATGALFLAIPWEMSPFTKTRVFLEL
jgi:hypothetical protein